MVHAAAIAPAAARDLARCNSLVPLLRRSRATGSSAVLHPSRQPLQLRRAQAGMSKTAVKVAGNRKRAAGLAGASTRASSWLPLRVWAGDGREVGRLAGSLADTKVVAAGIAEVSVAERSRRRPFGERRPWFKKVRESGSDERVGEARETREGELKTCNRLLGVVVEYK